jgi:triacylglycerol lipase
MAGDKLQSEINAKGQPSLNVGLLDQKKAFEWVRKNIAAFGGDPTRITAMGQSAGAISIGAHLLAESGNQKLFDRAYLVSGAAPLLYLTPSQMDYSFNLYAESMGCSNNDQQLTCLRSLNATILNSASALYSAIPVLDGNYIKGQAITQLEAGQFSKVPLFIQTNKDEGTLFPLYFGILTEDQATENIRTLIPPILMRRGRKTLINLYDPAAHPIYPGAAFGDFFADSFFYCPSTLMADIYSKHSVKVYTARNNHIPLINPFANLQVPTGVYHGSELPFLFKDRSEITKEENRFGKSMRLRIGVFAEGSSPNPSWSTYSSGSNAAYDIETDQVVVDDRSLECNTILNLIRSRLSLE